MTGSAPAVCVVGSVNVDTTYRVAAIPVPGETTLATSTFVAPGGKGANQAMTAALLGASATFIGCVGEDQSARLVRDSLVNGGVGVSQLATVPDAPTGTAVLVVDDRGENVIIVDPGANQRIDPARVAAHLAETAYDVVLVQLEINLPAVVSAAENKRAATFVLNPAPMVGSPEALREVLDRTDVLVPNRQELARLADAPVPRDADELDRCVERLDVPGAVVVTLGSAGVAVYESARQPRPILIDPVSVRTVDTTGAGDVFCGAFAYFLAGDGDVLMAAGRANELAALSTTVRGARITRELVSAADRRPGSGAPVRSS